MDLPLRQERRSGSISTNAHDRASGGTREHEGVGSWRDQRPHADRGLLGKHEQVVPTEQN